MTVKKYLKQVAALFNAEKRKCEKEKKCLREALKKLKKREGEVEERLGKLKSDRARKKLKSELKILHAQRRKGQSMLKGLEQK